MKRRLAGVLEVIVPDSGRVPLVLDSPHSGTIWPADFEPLPAERDVRNTQDSFVDELIADTPTHGASLLCAEFPRVYIDPNRGLGDLDPEILAGPWSEPLTPGGKTGLGKGLIWRLCPPDLPIYERRLGVDEVRRRISRFYKPYHAVLAALIDELHAAHGMCWHVNCHSMKSLSTAMDAEGPGTSRPDIILSDRDGTSSGAELMDMLEGCFTGAGLGVVRNDPFKGAELVARYGRPAGGRHSVQIEINRKLYLDESTLERSDGFAAMQALMSEAVATLARELTRR